MRTFQQEQECLEVALQLIDGLDASALTELAGGYSNDLDLLLSDVIERAYEVLYGDPKLAQFKGGNNYTDKFSAAVEKQLQTSSFAYFIITMLNDFQVNWHHLEWCRLLEKYPRLCVLAARDHGKSYFFSYALPAWRMWRYSKAAAMNSESVRLCHLGFIFSFSKDQAINLMRILKENIDNNDILRDALVPNNQKENWSKTEVVAKNGARVIARGFGSSVRGAHPGWIIVDDPLKDSSMYSEQSRLKAIDSFHSVIMNMIVPRGQVTVVGTPFHRADLYGDLKTKEGWRVYEYPAIYPDGEILWSNRWCAKDLMRKKADQGTTIFSRELLCRPVSNDSSIFPYDMLNRSIRGMEDYVLVHSLSNFPKVFNRTVIGCDFAISGNAAADFSVFTVWGIDSDEVMWLLNVQRFKGRSYQDQVQILKSLNYAFTPHVIYAESNQFQIVMVNMIEKEGLPIFPHNTNKNNKYNFESGLPSLSVLFEKGMIRLPYGDETSKATADLMMMEFNSVTYTDKGIRSVDTHDDMPMSTWIATLAKNHDKGGSEIRFSFL